jgi:cysteine-rich repeat protein
MAQSTPQSAPNGICVRLTWLIGVAALCVVPAAARAECVGDCDGDGKVVIAELIIGVNIVLGIQDPGTCKAFQDQGGAVNISQLLKGVNSLLSGCPIVATPTIPIATQTATITTAMQTSTPTKTNGPIGTSTSTNTPAPSETPTLTFTPVPTITPGGTPVCGDGVIEPPETCDDGNTMDGDNCPSTCIIHTCQPSQTVVNVDVLIQPPAGTIGALDLFVRYPDTAVILPGTGTGAASDIINLPDTFPPATINDVDYGVRVIGENPDGLFFGDANLFFTAQFKLCVEAAKPAAADFRCSVTTATLVEGTDVSGATTCSVAVE